jgi:oxygen-independent coproporphyrinogen III oxidase
MAGIYLHVPFCKKACHYCNFHFSTHLPSTNDFVTALLNEIILQKDYLGKATIQTIYFGGGTPSLLSTVQINSIISQLHRYFLIASTAEITLEANPDDINPNNLQAWVAAGINRLSMGVQSFINEDLVWMNRAHTAEQAKHSIVLAQKAGIENISIDLIYGTPTLSDAQWESNVSTAMSMGIPHLSCYALTVEPHTALEKMIALHKKEPISSDKQAHQFLLLADWLTTAGYQHYEISNFAKPGWHSQHNTAYWQQKPYLGLGPSAHSYVNNTRRWNVANNANYSSSLANNQLLFEAETLTTVQQLNEYIMTSLRTQEGIDLNWIKNHFTQDDVLRLRDESIPFLQNNKMKLEKEHLFLTIEGKLLADGIAASLFF